MSDNWMRELRGEQVMESWNQKVKELRLELLLLSSMAGEMARVRRMNATEKSKIEDELASLYLRTEKLLGLEFMKEGDGDGKRNQRGGKE